MPRTRTRIAPHQGAPSLYINDVPREPYMYFFAEPVKEHIADFANAGIHLYSWGWSSTIAHSMEMGWKGDYSKFDGQIGTILDADPEAYLCPRLAVSAPAWWLETHPGDRLQFESEDSGTRRHYTSMASRAWLEEATAAMLALIGHADTMPYRDRIIGYQLTGGVNEWMYTFDPRFADFSPAAAHAFRKWLQSEYCGDAAALQQAWKRPGVDFRSATIPTAEERMNTDLDLLRSPGESRKVPDFWRFYSEINASALIHLCEAGKKATNGEKIFGAFYGYIVAQAAGYGAGRAPLNWGHCALGKVLRSSAVDFLCSPYQYTHRGVGGYDGPQMPEESVRLHGKLFLCECDSTTFTGKSEVQGLPGVPNRAETFAILKRDFSHRFITRQGMWWMDPAFGEGWYHHPDTARFLARTRELREKSACLGMQYRAEVAVFVSERSPGYLKPGVALLHPLVFMQQFGLARMGAPYDLYLLEDLQRPGFPDYKLYIFLDALYLPREERNTIKRVVRRNHKVAVWMYAPGLLDERGISAENMFDLTGVRLNYRRAGNSQYQMSSRLYLTNFDHGITANLPCNTWWGTDSLIGPVVYAEDPDAITLGRLLPPHALPRAIGEFPGFVVKESTNWTSVFIGAPNVPSDVLRNIACWAGCHIYNDDNDVLYANPHFLMVHTAKAGLRRFRLARRSDVYDAFTEKRIAKNSQEFTDRLAQYATRLYFLGDIDQIGNPKTRFEL